MATAFRTLMFTGPPALALLSLAYPERALALLGSALLLAVFLFQVAVTRNVKRPARAPNDARRALLRRGLFGAVGAAGLTAGLPHALAGAAPLAVPGSRRFTATALHLRIADGKGHAELFDSSERKLGDFYSATTMLEAPYGDAPAMGIHQHVFVFSTGILFGMGAGPLAEDESTFSIVGGTGEYAGAGGIYKAAQRPRDLGGNGAATFKFRLKR